MSLLTPLKRIMAQYCPLFAMMEMDCYSSQVTKMIFFPFHFMFITCIRYALCFLKFSWFCGKQTWAPLSNIHLFLELACVLPLMENMQSLLKYVQRRNIFICDLIAVVNVC
jgi:hypothetical protein